MTSSQRSSHTGRWLLVALALVALVLFLSCKPSESPARLEQRLRQSHFGDAWTSPVAGWREVNYHLIHDGGAPAWSLNFFSKGSTVHLWRYIVSEESPVAFDQALRKRPPAGWSVGSMRREAQPGLSVSGLRLCGPDGMNVSFVYDALEFDWFTAEVNAARRSGARYVIQVLLGGPDSSGASSC